MTSFHKNNIFVKTRKVMGNTDVAHYRGQLATTLPTFLNILVGFGQQAERIKHLNMLVNIKILARILMFHIGCS